MKNWYSVRMRSSQGGPHEEGGIHISGAERLIVEKDIEQHALEMIQRATTHSRGKADFISLKIEAIPSCEIQTIAPLNVKEVVNPTIDTTKKVLAEQLSSLPIQTNLILSLYEQMINNDSTKGAIIVDINSGQRLDPPEKLGVRVSHFDWDKQFKQDWVSKQEDLYNDRRTEAIALASKVAAAGTICELCCSDDPEYTTGYIAFKNTFIRIPNMKQKDSSRGGRVFIVDGKKIDLQKYIHFLEKTPVLLGGKK